MIVLVDGYNLLRQIHGKETHENQRSALVNLLGRYVQKRNHKIVVFFDGGTSAMPYQEKQKSITIWFSGQNKTADDLIIEYVEHHKGKDMVVITLDRDLKNKCGLYAPSLEPLVFYGRIQELLAPSPKAVVKHDNVLKKLTGEDDPELDALMSQASAMSPGSKDDTETLRGKNGEIKKLSKKQKLKNKIIDTL